MTKILQNINDPSDLKPLNNNELNQLATEIRDFIIENLSKTGGHLAPNLGVVELTLALHQHLNSPEDKIIWDVGHQSYTHKIITGRKDKFNTLRQEGGLSGYPKVKESKHDIIETGHTATSISSALGLTLARDLKGDSERIYAVIGDGALTGGMAFEALNHAGHLGKDFNVILNDNEMSIASNVGALSHYLSNLRTDPKITKIKDDLEYLLNKIPKIGTKMSKSAERLKNGLKYTIIPGILFEEMGFTYLGPVDGHNISELKTHLKKADKIDGPTLIHVNTIKGKGYKPAEETPSKYHGTGPFEIESGKSKNPKENFTYSQVFGKSMVKLGKENEEIVGITAAMPKGTGLNIFENEFPERSFDVGIAEQHAMTLGAGLARGGKRPVVALYSTFLQRAYDQVIHDVCIQNLPVSIAIDRAGIVGNDGETHQGAFDYSFLRTVPNMVVMAPKDENELQHMLKTSVNHSGPTALRYPRGEGIGVDLDNKLKELEIGKGEVLKEGEDVLLLAIGSMVYPSLKAAKSLEEKGISATVINARFVKPLDEELIEEYIRKTKAIITLEEQALKGGFGSAVLELISDKNIENVKIKRIGLPDHFILHGGQQKMRSKYNLDKEGIVKEVFDFLNNRPEVRVWPKKNV
ncbi:MAG: 1-deoxy-D-xylulose-5-phosphate synthase [Bacillota bacterium]